MNRSGGLFPTAQGPKRILVNFFSLIVSVSIGLVACDSKVQMTDAENTFLTSLFLASANSQKIPLVRLTQFDWDFVCIAHPYEGSDVLVDQLKSINRSVPKKINWYGSEQFSRFVFFQGANLVKVIRVDASDFYIQPSKKMVSQADCFYSSETMLNFRQAITGAQITIEFSLD